MYSKDELLIQTAKKKPRLQAYIDGLASLDESDIMALSEPAWIREALIILKQNNEKGQKQRKIEFLAHLDQQTKMDQHLQATAKYDIKIWSTELSFFKGTTMDGRRTWEVEIKEGEPILIKDNDVVLIAGEFYRLSSVEMARIVDSSKFLMEATIQEYFNYYKDVYLYNRY